ncbi:MULTISPECIES: hypothetical protein [unclassified Nocardia]|uniref:hypothetical protein n=1 Tax=unclassified Nocardia TaxID=2637762 RepID=UPI0030E4EAFD
MIDPAKPSLSRRALLRGAGGAAALTFGATVSGRGAWLPRARAEDPSGLPTVDELWNSVVAMNDLGPRHTGNAAHRQFVDSIDTSLRDLNIQVLRDRVSFTRWEAGRMALSVDDIAQPVAAYVPYSGSTGAEGIEGELEYVGIAHPDGFPAQSLQDKIVVTDALSPIIPMRLARPLLNYLQDPSGTVTDDDVVSVMALSMTVPLTVFRLAGAKAVIVVLDAAPDNAAGQYVPFLFPMAGIPGLIVDRKTGAELRERARAGGRARVTLEATIEHGATTDDVIGILPGASSDISLINTHTDGPNAIEENGPVAVLALARKLAAIPQSQRRRTYVFLFATGHMAVAVGDTERFIGNHPDLIRRTASALTIEHLGATEWVDDPVLGYHATGKPDLTPILTSQNPALWEAARTAIQANNLERAGILPAVANNGFAGVGVFLNLIGVPTVALAGTPAYLASWAADGHIDKLDRDILYRQVQTCDSILRNLDATPRLDLALGGTLLNGGGQILPEVVGAGWDIARTALPFAGLLGTTQ